MPLETLTVTARESAALGPPRRQGRVRKEVVRLWLPMIVLAAGAVMLAWGLAVPLNQGLRSDEVTSLFRYIAGGPSAIWSHYIPNDHILFEVLTWGLRKATGDGSEAALRLWSVLPALAGAGLLTWWTWRRLDRWIAAVFIALGSAAPVFLDLAMEARGYGLAFLASALMVVGADRAREPGDRRGIAAVIAGGAMGIWSLPVFVLPFLVILALLLWARIPRGRLFGAALLVGVSSLVFYAPVLGQLIKASGQKDGRQLGVAGFIVGPLQDQLQPSVQTLIHPVTSLTANAFASHIISNWASAPSLGPDLIAAGALCAGVLYFRSRGDAFLGALLLAPAVVSYLVIEIVRFYVISRFLSFLLLPLLVLGAAGIVGVARFVARTRLTAVAVTAAGIVLCFFVIGRSYDLTHITAVQSRTIVSNDVAAFPSYLAPQLITPETPSQMQSLACSGSYAFTFLEFYGKQEPATIDACLQQRRADLLANLRIHVNHHYVPAKVWAVARDPRFSGGGNDGNAGAPVG